MTLIRSVPVPYCGVCSKACRETFSLRKGNGDRVQAGDCCALQVAADIYRVALTFGAELTDERAVNEASDVLQVFAIRFRAGVYRRDA